MLGGIDSPLSFGRHIRGQNAYIRCSRLFGLQQRGYLITLSQSQVSARPVSIHFVDQLFCVTFYLSEMMCYFIYWLLQLPFMFVTPQRIRYLFTAKAIIVPAAWIAMLIWAMVKVPPSVSLAAKESTVGGSTFSWAWLGSLNSALGIYATLAVNIPDFTVSAASLAQEVANSLFYRIPRDMQRMRERERS